MKVHAEFLTEPKGLGYVGNFEIHVLVRELMDVMITAGVGYVGNFNYEVAAIVFILFNWLIYKMKFIKRKKNTLLILVILNY